MELNELNRRDLTINAVNYLNLDIDQKNNIEYVDEVSVHCPWHKDKTPSLYINLNNGIYHCFSCHRSGNIENMFKDLTGQSLYKTLGIKTDRFSSFARSFNYSNEEEYIDRSKEIKINFDKNDILDIDSNEDCIKYIRKRGISLDIARSMGFKYTYEARINNTRFSNRLLIPVYENKKLISIEGRRIYDNGEKKVLYPKNSSSNTLFDIDNLNKNEDVYGVEGIMDLAVLRSCNVFNNSTSIFGACLTGKQIDMISKFKKFIYIPDLDEAGNNTIIQLKESGLTNVYILKLPKIINGIEVKDVGDVPKTGNTVSDLISRKWLNYIKKL